MNNTQDANFLIVDAGSAMGTLADVTRSAVDGYGNGSRDHLDTLGALRLVELAAAQARRAVVLRAHAEGYTWQELGDALGTSRQAVQQRYGKS